MITRLEEGEGTTGTGGTVAGFVVPVAAAPVVGWVLLLTMSAADSTQFWQF